MDGIWLGHVSSPPVANSIQVLRPVRSRFTKSSGGDLVNNETGVITDSDELFEFLGQIGSYYHVGRQSAHFSERDFIIWVVVRAGELYLKYVLEPESGHC
jgi:hypothetical protein